MSPKFSIAIPVYNRREYLKSAVASCLVQTVNSFEIVVSDDCSGDDLQRVAEAFGDSRIRYSRSNVRLGATKNHERAVALSQGKYVLNLHSDDMLLPNCLEVAGAALDGRPYAAATYFGCAYLKKDKVDGTSLVPDVGFSDRTGLGEHPWLEKFHGTGPSCCLFRRENFDRLGGYRTSLRFAYDWDIYMRFLASGGGVIFLPQVLCSYRFHDEQAVQTSNIDGLWDMLDLWALEENAHWLAKDIAGLVVSQCTGALRKGEGVAGIAAILGQVRRRGLGWRVLAGVPGAFQEKFCRRVFGDIPEDTRHYVVPLNREAALEKANAMIQANGTA
jgi:glycosyltransferase involved in cell wall biosynthesis